MAGSLHVTPLEDVLFIIDDLLVQHLLVNYRGLYAQIRVSLDGLKRNPVFTVEYNWCCMDAYGLGSRVLRISEFNIAMALEGWTASEISVGVTEQTAELWYLSGAGVRLRLLLSQIKVMHITGYNAMVQEPATIEKNRVPRITNTGHYMFHRLFPSKTMEQNIGLKQKLRSIAEQHQERDIDL